MVNLQYGLTKIKYNIRRIKQYKSDTKVDDFSSKNLSDDVNIRPPIIQFCIKY